MDDRLAELLQEGGPWTFAYVDGPGEEPQVVEETRQDAVRRRLTASGAPDDDVAALADALRDRAGLAAPSARYLLARRGVLEMDESLPGARRGPDQVGHGPLPPLLPLVRHRDGDRHYVVVEAGREGTSVRWERAGRLPEIAEEVEGRTDSLPKVQAGGWSQARYQRSSEEVWKRNQRQVARAVDEIVRDRAPAFVIVAGDVRARQLLRDDLGEAARRMVVEVDAHTRADGADGAVLDEAIADEIARRHDAAVAETSDRADAGRGRRGAHGLREVVAALQQAQVDTLLLDARLIESDQQLDALDAPPWVGYADEDDTGDAGVVAPAPVAEALVRAAVLTGADVLVTEDESADGEPRDPRAPREPLAVLHWAT